MKKELKILLSLCCLITLSSCSKGVTINKLIGTYELSNYDFDYIDENISDIDVKERDNIRAYLVITGEEYGFYVYEDNNTVIDAKEVLLTYKYDSDDTNKITSIEYSLETSDLKYGIPGGYKEVLKVEKENLTSKRQDKNANDDVFYKRVQYTKINNLSSLDDLENLLNIELPFISYKMYKMHASFILDLKSTYEQSEKYVYYLYDINGYTSKATIYYALKENKIPTVIEDVDVTLKTIDNIEYYILNDISYSYITSVPSYLYASTSDWFIKLNRAFDLDIQDYINNALENA
ncbi:MAG: hypothetical protein ACI311_04630 [Bacilli bacterium]